MSSFTKTTWLVKLLRKRIKYSSELLFSFLLNSFQALCNILHWDILRFYVEKSWFPLFFFTAFLYLLTISYTKHNVTIRYLIITLNNYVYLSYLNLWANFETFKHKVPFVKPGSQSTFGKTWLINTWCHSVLVCFANRSIITCH